MVTKKAAPAERGVPAYRELAEKLRADIEAGVYSVGRKMPTESVLQSVHNVSRHTVREALQILLSDGLIYRVQGSGTYVSGRQQDTRGRYVRSIGSLDEIIVWPDTNTEVIEPFTVVVEPSIAARLELPYIEVSKATVRRSYEGLPFVLTRHYVEPELGAKLAADGVPSVGEGTVIGAAEKLLTKPIMGARQEITAMNAPEHEAELIGCQAGDAILLIERLYYDADGKFVEFTSSHFNPRRYSYRMELRRRGA
ncbi:MULTISPECIES: GntR family transcriptional regulator [Rhodococcus]|uniref:GntR family transcriptional regulator n=1 Tax=Rhodococcus aetherivorans TaxID=191292 RepID=A0AA46P1G5_9NOCA|nr:MULTISPECIES: GntR family transcriptional regulator [Rhodococcus]AKE87937.1 GntR family transcriptional regulator [Rhodococcus aetherivorans]MDV6293363.1 GntR family transcriptional regulator [Rhodococcus aetherivorans]OLL19944.1 GntR family transcriptional regulator [Rhodococcus sp. M8]QRI76749.1 GntR family transcriptional regulator [Rhodococcus aetherivorans]QSE60167.1 GntR family transcriptional regulator [Rhodococcus sp. PSBB066]